MKSKTILTQAFPSPPFVGKRIKGKISTTTPYILPSAIRVKTKTQTCTYFRNYHMVKIDQPAKVNGTSVGRLTKARQANNLDETQLLVKVPEIHYSISSWRTLDEMTTLKRCWESGSEKNIYELKFYLESLREEIKRIFYLYRLAKVKGQKYANNKTQEQEIDALFLLLGFSKSKDRRRQKRLLRHR